MFVPDLRLPGVLFSYFFSFLFLFIGGHCFAVWTKNCFFNQLIVIVSGNRLWFAVLMVVLPDAVTLARMILPDYSGLTVMVPGGVRAVFAIAADNGLTTKDSLAFRRVFANCLRPFGAGVNVALFAAKGLGLHGLVLDLRCFLGKRGGAEQSA